MTEPPALDRWIGDIRRCEAIAMDTNAVIYYVEGRSPYDELIGYAARLTDEGAITMVMSAVVESEALVKPLRENDSAMTRRYELFFNGLRNLAIVDMNRAIARRAAEIRADTGLRLPDAIVAATALEAGCGALIGNDAAMARLDLGLPYLHLDDYIE